jgi:hypothetical protein
LDVFRSGAGAGVRAAWAGAGARAEAGARAGVGASGVVASWDGGIQGWWHPGVVASWGIYDNSKCVMLFAKGCTTTINVLSEWTAVLGVDLDL